MNKRKIIVSLTSWEKRLCNLKPVLTSILNQDTKPDAIELNLSIEEFPNKENSLPQVLIDFIEKNSTIHINWTEHNTGIFKKIIPTLKKYKDVEPYYLLSIDDDWIYRKDYISMMINRIEFFNGDSFCPSNGKIVGNRMIYKSEIFREDFWSKLTSEVIRTRIDDSYIQHYLNCYHRNMTNFQPNNIMEITIQYNPIFPNSHNDTTGTYSIEDIQKANKVIKSIVF